MVYLIKIKPKTGLYSPDPVYTVLISRHRSQPKKHAGKTALEHDQKYKNNDIVNVINGSLKHEI